jgi:DNA-binding PadR family transcriptional regulator
MRAMTDVHAVLPLNPREFLILFALVEGESHGYGLVKSVNERTDGRIPMDPANLYRAIKRLIRNGLVTERDKRRAPESNDERRRYYAITPFGRKVVAAEAARLDELASAARAMNLIPDRHKPA